MKVTALLSAFDIIVKYIPYLSTSCQVTNKAFTELYHLSLLAAAYSHLCPRPPSCSFSFFLRCASPGVRVFHLCHFTSSLTGFIPALSSSSSVLIWSCHDCSRASVMENVHCFVVSLVHLFHIHRVGQALLVFI